MHNPFPGLDFDFLRYMGVRPENQRRIQSIYLPYFADRLKVLDLGCGNADFVEMLKARGVDVVGIDSDEKAYQAAITRQLPIVQSDVFTYLRELPSESVDGIFSAHLVEHLPYPLVIELARQSFRVLRSGGVVIWATPNVRSLFSHLEMYYLHFGHISFYHPRLLCFFLEHEGFIQLKEGENPETASPFLQDAFQALNRSSELEKIVNSPISASPLQPLLNHASEWFLRQPLTYHREIPLQGHSLLQRFSYQAKRHLTRWLVQPFLDEIVTNLNSSFVAQNKAQAETLFHLTQILAQEIQRLRGDVHSLLNSLQTLNGAFECYVVGYKPTRSEEK